MLVGGGGGTDMQVGFDEVLEKAKEVKAKGQKPVFQTILFSDMELPASNFYPENIPDNTMFIAPLPKIRLVPKDVPDPARNIKVIAIDVVTGLEVSIMGPKTATQKHLQQTALSKLNYQLRRQKIAG